MNNHLMNVALPNRIMSINNINNSELFWQAVQNRDQRFDGQFVYGVTSTMIYCRPSCPSRRPLRDRVQFFNEIAVAEKAGFRSCRRCQPQINSSSQHPQVTKIYEACRYIEDHLEEAVTLEDLAVALNCSPYHLQRLFKRMLGISPKEYLDELRLSRLKEELRSNNDVTTAQYEVGYGSSSRLYERANAHLGMTPATYQRGGKGKHISYTIASSPLGYLLVAATYEGICAVRLGDDEKDLTATLFSEFPAATIERDDEVLQQHLTKLLDYLAGQQPELNLPLDIHATAFQRQVWQELQNIPYGETRSYSKVAAAIGQPKAVRAVARACAANPVALIIPCHRVIREDGSLGGYRWGMQRKSTLLQREHLA